MKILFVCSGNAHRSPLAEALLKKMRSDLDVDSAGIHTAIPIAEEIKKYLAKEDALQYLKNTPESIHSKKLSDYDLIIAMEQKHKDIVTTKCPECKNKTEAWDVDDPYFLPQDSQENIYNKIKENIIKLAKSL
jgi:protein-tyrosine phosphatase